MNETARLLAPALRWDRAHGFGYLQGLIDDALELGVGAFIVEGGPKDAVADLIGRLHADSAHPILVGVPAARGAGETIEGLTHFPPFGAVASAAVVDANGRPALDVDVVRRAARLTARELKNLGANWALAPCCDLDLARGNPEVGARGASDDPAVASAVVAEWVDACQAEGVIACAGNFPGLARAANGAISDPVSVLRGSDLIPFAGAIDAGVACIMVSSVRVPHLGAPEGVCRSAAVVENVLRGELHFDGIAAAGLFDMDRALDRAREGEIAVSAIAAGCDLIAAPVDLSGAADALARAASRNELTAARIRAALGRMDRWAGWARPSDAREPSLDDLMWSRQLGDACVRWVRGGRPRIGAQLEVVNLAPAPVDRLVAVLRAMHIDVTESGHALSASRAPVIITVSPPDESAAVAARELARRVDALVRASAAAGREVALVSMSHPRTSAELGANVSVLAAWDASRPMQEAAARALLTAR